MLTEDLILKASTMDFGVIRRFVPSEFPGKALEYLDESIVRVLDEYAVFLKHPVHLTTLEAGFYRFGGSERSRHWVGPAPSIVTGREDVRRLSTAVDVFPFCDTGEAFEAAVNCREFGGIGIYYDTKYGGKDRTMFHFDLRERPLWWCRVGGIYYYPANGGDHRKMFYGMLSESA